MGSWRRIERHLLPVFAFVHEVRLLDCGDGQVSERVPLRLGAPRRENAVPDVGIRSPRVSVKPEVIEQVAGGAVRFTSGMTVTCGCWLMTLVIEQAPSQGRKAG